MIKYRLTTISVMISSLLVSCTDRLAEQKTVPVEEPAASEKLVFTPENAVAGKLLVYFSGEAAEKVEHSSLTRSGGPLTRSGIEEFDRVLENIGVRSLHRVFPVDKRNEERTRKAGLHRWYTVEFDETADLKEAALAMAAVAEVSKVEFNLRMERTSDLKTIPFAGTGNRLQQSSSEAVFNDPYLDLQWNYMNTGNTEIYSGIKAGADADCVPAWRLCTGDPRVVVAVVDDCVQWNHPDLEANMWINGDEIPGNGIDDDGNGLVDDIHGYNFVNDTSLTLSDGFEGSHGTHVAGTVAAVNGNGTGVCGIAGGSGSGDGARIMSCQIFHNEDLGNGTAEVSAKAIKYAADNGASILQCSFGYTSGAANPYEYGIGYRDADEWEVSSPLEKAAMDYFIHNAGSDNGPVKGGIPVFASGNEYAPMAGFPGAYEGCVSVAAVAGDFTPSTYTNYAEYTKISAPGGDQDYYYDYKEPDGDRGAVGCILSTVPEHVSASGYGYMEGTSMACPHVSGVVALGLSYAAQLHRHFSADEFIDLLLSEESVTPLTNEILSGDKFYYKWQVDAEPLIRATRMTLSSYRNNMGSGVVNAAKFLNNIQNAGVEMMFPNIYINVGSSVTVNPRAYLDGTSFQVTVNDPSVATVGAAGASEGTATVSTDGNLVFFGLKSGSTTAMIGSQTFAITVRSGESGSDWL